MAVIYVKDSTTKILAERPWINQSLYWYNL